MFVTVGVKGQSCQILLDPLNIGHGQNSEPKFGYPNINNSASMYRLSLIGGFVGKKSTSLVLLVTCMYRDGGQGDLQ